MKLKNIFKFAVIAAAAATMTGVTSCNYLDVVPPEQPGLPDGMKNHDNAKGFLYSCYNKMFQRDYLCRDYRSTINASTDEYLITETWYANEGAPAYAILRNTQTTTAPAGYDPDFWNTFYAGIGQTLLFDQQLDDEGQKNDVNQGNTAEYKEWKAESRFCRAFYHFQLLRLYGPIPITNELVSQETGLDEYPGRSHFDACVDWIAAELDAAAADLPETRDPQDLGRATSVICKALKARLLLYAASDLWNGKFPAAYNGWRNTNFQSTHKTYTNPANPNEEVTDYELVYRGEPRELRWRQALVASRVALNAAIKAGYRLYDPKFTDSKDLLYQADSPDVVWVPNETDLAASMQAANVQLLNTNVPNYDPEANLQPDDDNYIEAEEFSIDEFKRAVWKLRLLSSTTQSEGNTEIIWSQSEQVYGWKDARLPRNAKLITKDGSTKRCEGWNGVAPTLYTVEHFLNADGTLPGGNYSLAFGQLGTDAFYNFPTPTVDNGDGDRTEVTNICLNREPRFYAWIGFHNGDFLSGLDDGEPLILDMRDPLKQGRELVERNYSATGFLSMKHLDPYYHWDKDGNVVSGKESPEVFIRMAELYLNLAECEAEYADRFGDNPPAEFNAVDAKNSVASLASDAIKQINKLRDRAYVGRLKPDMIGMVETLSSNGQQKTWNLVEWVRNERFIELYDEGQRYFDVRRWVAGEEYFGYGKRRALNALVEKPSAKDFFRPMMANPQYTFHYREYLYPIYVDEVYKNPQMVQNPGF